jgi:DNA-binding protein HU-beta
MNEIRVSMAEERENVYLRGFGTFTVKHRAKKTARNISKNTTMVIDAHDIPAFKPAKSFIEKMK